MPGSAVLFILRTAERARFELVGESFVYGIMEGELADSLDWQEIETE